MTYMDYLISREAVKEKFPLMENGFGLINERFHKGIDELPSAFEGMTNGEVIQALFPNGKVIECDEATGYEQMLDDENSYCSWFDSLWWNAPYNTDQESEGV
jgi:hypothetical protein